MAEIIKIVGDNYVGHFDIVRVACRALVIQNGLMLLSHEENGDKWMLPGGGLEKGETEEDCVVREVEEETGYVIKPSECLLEIEEFYGNEKYISKYFAGEIQRDGKQHLTSEELKEKLHPMWIMVEEISRIFSEYKRYEVEDEMKSGMYLREYSALKNCKLNSCQSSKV